MAPQFNARNVAKLDVDNEACGFGRYRGADELLRRRVYLGAISERAEMFSSARRIPGSSSMIATTFRDGAITLSLYWFSSPGPSASKLGYRHAVAAVRP